MSEPSSKKVLEPQLIFFDNDNVAKAILPPLEEEPKDTAGLVKPVEGWEPQEILAALEIPATEAVLLISGGAAQVDQSDEFVKSRLAGLFSRGVALAAAEKKAVIIDGGTYAGVMAMIGQGVADRYH